MIKFIHATGFILGFVFSIQELRALEVIEEDMPTREEMNRYDDLIGSFELTHQELDALKLTMSAPSSRIISPENIKSITLGSPISTSTSSFDYGSIFDGGMLNKAGLINTLDGDSKVRSEVQVTANTRKTFNTNQVKGSGQLAVQWGGFRSTNGYLHENAQQKSQLTGEVTANAYQYLSKEIGLRLYTGNDPIEMSQYLRGTPFDSKQLGKYITVTPLAVSEVCIILDWCERYSKVKVNSIYEGKGQDNPRAHVELLSILEGHFDNLSLQHAKYLGNAKVSSSSVEDMRALRKAINQSIQAFYDKYGDSFTSKLYGYNQVRATAKMIKNEKAENDESNNALSIGAAYGGFVGGVQAQVDVQWYQKKAFEENRNSLAVKAEAEPASDVNLSSWEDKVLKFLKEVNPTITVPSDVVTKQGVPSLPKAAELRYDPTMPPGVTLAKYDDYKMVEADYRNKYDDKSNQWKARGKAIVNTIFRRNNNQQPGGGGEGGEIARAGTVIENLGSVVNNPPANQEPPALNGGLRRSGALPVVDPLSGNNHNSRLTEVVSLLAENNSSYSENMNQHERELRREIKALKAEGRREYFTNHLNARLSKVKVKQILRRQANENGSSDGIRLASTPVKAANTTGQESQFVGLSGSVVAGFDVAPYAAHLAVLRPKLIVPGDPDPVQMFSGYPNLYDLAMVLHNYEIIDTYLSFISRFEVSGLKNRKISENYTKFFSGDRSTGYKGFQGRALDLIEIALATGKDISNADLEALLQSLIFGRNANDVSDYKNTELYKLLGNDGFTYVMSLLDLKVSANGKWEQTGEKCLDIIRRAPGGYIPVKVDSQKNPLFVSNTKANKTPSSGLFGGDWMIRTDSIPLESGFDLSRLYSQRNQSPLYPVFAYNDKKSSTLLFMQFAASSTLVYGRIYSMYPNFDCKNDDSTESCGSLTSIETIIPTVQDAADYDRMRSQENGFDHSKNGFGYSVVYPKASIDDNRVNAINNNALIIGLDGDNVKVDDAKPNRYSLAPTATLLEPFKIDAGAKYEVLNTYDALDYDVEGNSKPSLYSLFDLAAQQNNKNNWGYMVLLPVDSELLTRGRFDSLFTFSNDTTPAAIYGLRADGKDGFNGGTVRAMLR